jgi:polysaccharide pyruvyl transferase CsaB
MTDQPQILVSGWVGADNIGDELIFRSLATKLADRGVAVTTMSTRPAATRSLHGVDAVGWSDLPGTLGAIRASDGLIVGPGGILQDETSVWNLPAHLHRVVVARTMRTPVLGLGLGAGPLNTATGRSIVRSALRSVPLTVRDEDSARLLTDIGLRRVAVTADLAYGLPVPEDEAADRIVVSLRPFSGSGGLVPARRSDLRTLESDDRVTAAAAALDELARRSSLPVHLLAFEAERDARHHDLIAEQMTESVTTGIANINTVFEEVSRSRLVVGMRYHAVVSAVMASRPTVVIGYSPKARSIARRLGDAGLLVQNDPASYHEVAEGASLLGRDDRVAAVRAERRKADAGNDAALDRFLARR